MSALMEMSRPQAMATAQRMYENDWTIVEIRNYLAARGHDHIWETIRRWADPEFAERRAREQREGRRRRWRQKNGASAFRILDRDAQETRARSLLSARVTKVNVTRVMAFDFPDDGWTYRRVCALAASPEQAA